MLDNDQVLAEAFSRNTVIAGMILSENGLETPPAPKVGTGFGGTPPKHLMQSGMKAIRNLSILDEAATGIGNFHFDTLEQGDSVVRKTTLLRGANGHYYPSLTMETYRVLQGAGSFKMKFSNASGELSGGVQSVVSVQVGGLEIPTDGNGALTIYHSPSNQKPTLSAKSLLYPSREPIDGKGVGHPDNKSYRIDWYICRGITGSTRHTT